MRLINVKTLRLEEFLEYQAPRYAILSHTWGKDAEEISFRDVKKGKIDKPGIGSRLLSSDNAVNKPGKTALLTSGSIRVVLIKLI